jgi:type III pantothenate kinase
MIVDIDIGNTRAKYRLIGDDGVSGPTQACAHADLPAALHALPLDQLRVIRIASVAAHDVTDNLIRAIGDQTGARVGLVTSQSHCAGVTNSYAEPQRLGVDRWLGVLAAYNRWRAPCIIIDAGTALKIDVVDADGVHQGGWIVPGLAMLRSSLIAGTAGVRFEARDAPSLALGRSTAEAVQNGTLAMAVAWLNTSVSRLLADYRDAHVVLCGGDAAALRSYLSFDALDWPDIVLDGLALVPVGD